MLEHPGLLSGSMCAVCGILVMALPIPIVVDNFADYYQEQKKLEAAELKAEAQAVEAEWRSEQHETAMQGLLETVQATQLGRAVSSRPLSYRVERLITNGEIFISSHLKVEREKVKSYDLRLKGQVFFPCFGP